MGNSYASTLNIAIRAARKAGNHIAKSLENAEKIQTTQKGSNDFVTNVDKEAEAIIVSTIKSSYPEHCIIAEEGGLIEGKDKEVQWIIDPLDGTTNFVKVSLTLLFLLRYALEARLKSLVFTTQ